MNIVQIQDMLKFVPDDKLKEELANPNGPAPQYLILSEVVRRDKMRGGSAEKPSTTVLQDILGGGTPQEPQAFASGGFISASESMGNAGVAGYPTQQPKLHNPVSANTGITSMFAPSPMQRPAPPQTVNNVQVTQPQPKPDDGQTNDFNSPSYYEQGAYADGGEVRLASGDYVSTLIGAESTGNRYAKNPRSTATGLGQFIDSTWLAYLNDTQPGLVDKIGERAALNLRTDPDLSKDAIKWYEKKNTADLVSAGFQPTQSNLYLAHFAGPGGAKAILSADPNASAAAILGKQVADANPFLKKMTASDLINWTAKKMGDTAGATGQQGKPMSFLTDLFYGRPMGAGQGAAGFEARAEGLPSPSMATRTGGIMDLVGLKPGTPGADRRLADMKSLGAQMMQPQQIQAPDPIPMAEGNVQGLARLYTDPAQMAQAMTDYGKYMGAMASGGAVRMDDGGSPPSGELTVEQLSKMTPEELKAYKTRQYLESDAHKKWLENVNKNNFGRTPPAPNRSGIPTQESIKKTEESWATGFPSMFLTDEQRIEAAKRAMGQKTSDISAASTPGLFSDDFRATPSQLHVASREAERARSKKEELSPLDKLLNHMAIQQQRMQDLYADQIEKERQAMKEDTSFGAFLRRMGIGMLTDSSSLGRSLQAGAAAATSGTQESRQAAQDRIRALELKQQMGDIESADDISKLVYNAATAGVLGPKDYFGSIDDIGKVLSSLEESIKENGGNPDENPTVRSLRRAMQTALSRSGVSDTMGFAGFPAGTVITQTR